MKTLGMACFWLYKEGSPDQSRCVTFSWCETYALCAKSVLHSSYWWSCKKYPWVFGHPRVHSSLQVDPVIPYKCLLKFYIKNSTVLFTKSRNSPKRSPVAEVSLLARLELVWLQINCDKKSFAKHWLGFNYLWHKIIFVSFRLSF